MLKQRTITYCGLKLGSRKTSMFRVCVVFDNSIQDGVTWVHEQVACETKEIIYMQYEITVIFAMEPTPAWVNTPLIYLI